LFKTGENKKENTDRANMTRGWLKLSECLSDKEQRN